MASYTPRELDFLIGEHVTKCFPFNIAENFSSREELLDIASYHVPEYTSDIEAAWELVEFMRDSEYRDVFAEYVHARASTIYQITPMVIGVAALRVVGIDVDVD